MPAIDVSMEWMNVFAPEFLLPATKHQLHLRAGRSERAQTFTKNLDQVT